MSRGRMRATDQGQGPLRAALHALHEKRRFPAGGTDSKHEKQTLLQSVGIKHLTMDQSLGEIAYAAYCQAVGYKSVRGDTLPIWEDQSERLRETWERVGEAVAEYLEKA
jgi:hypothetical protein